VFGSVEEREGFKRLVVFCRVEEREGFKRLVVFCSAEEGWFQETGSVLQCRGGGFQETGSVLFVAFLIRSATLKGFEPPLIVTSLLGPSENTVSHYFCIVC
jgi:hypothetical protein